MTRARIVKDNRSTMRAALLSAAWVAGTVLAFSNAAVAQSVPMIYPSQGQSMEQQSHDESECRVWAQQRTGFDPWQSPAPTCGSTAQQGQVVGGAARGALLGAVGGAIAGDAGRGAAIGAGVGTTAGLLRRHQQVQTQQQAQQQEIARHNQQRAEFDRTFATCMTGRDYAVN